MTGNLSQYSRGGIQTFFIGAFLTIILIVSRARGEPSLLGALDLANLSAALPSICEAYVRAYVGTHTPGVAVEHDILFVAPIHFTSVLCRTGRPDLQPLRKGVETGRFYFITEKKASEALTLCDNDGGLLRPLYESFLLARFPFDHSAPPTPYASAVKYDEGCHHASSGVRPTNLVDYTWTDWWTISTTPWRIPPPLKKYLLAQHPERNIANSHRRPSLVISTPGLGLQTAESCRHGNTAANCLSPNSILRMAIAAEALGYDTILWPTILSHDGVSSEALETKKKGDADAADWHRHQRIAADAALFALQELQLNPVAPAGLRVVNHSIQAALLGGEMGPPVEEALAAMAQGSVFASAFGAGGSAILSYFGGISCILCDEYRDAAPGSAKIPYTIGGRSSKENGFLKGRFCRREVLEAMSGQVVQIVRTQEEAISCVEGALASAVQQPSEQEARKTNGNDGGTFFPYGKLFEEARELWQQHEKEEVNEKNEGEKPYLRHERLKEGEKDHEPQEKGVAGPQTATLEIGGRMHQPSSAALNYLCRIFRSFGQDIPEVQQGMPASTGFEFGPELVLKLPVVYFLHQCGMVKITRSCGDLSVFYYFSERHENVDCHRRGGLMHHVGASGMYFENSPVAFNPPPLREIYSQGENPVLKAVAANGHSSQVKTVVVTNRLDCHACALHQPPAANTFGEKVKQDLCCKQYLSNTVLRRLLQAIENGSRRTATPVRVIYNRVNHADPRLIGLSREKGGDYHDSSNFQSNFTRVCPRGGCFVSKTREEHEEWTKYMAHPVSEIDDETMLRAEFPDVIILADAYFAATHDKHQNISFNEFLVRTLSHAASFVSVQGGASYLVSYFGGCNEVCNFYGEYFNIRRATVRQREASQRKEKEKKEKETKEKEKKEKEKKETKQGSGRTVPTFGLHRRLHESEETYKTTLPRMGGAKVRHHGSGDGLVAAVESWWKDPLCGLVNGV